MRMSGRSGNSTLRLVIVYEAVELNTTEFKHIEKNTNGNCVLVHNDLVKSGFNQATSKMLELLAGLNKEVVSWGDANWDTFTRVTSPYV